MKDYFYKKLMRLTLPIALQSLLLASVAAADAFMLGRIEQNAMAAVSSGQAPSWGPSTGASRTPAPSTISSA